MNTTPPVPPEMPTGRPRKLFLTFGGGGEVYRQSSWRLGAEVRATGLFDELHCLTDLDLAGSPDFADFWRRHSAFVERSPRGYGYWLWKPYLIKRLLERIDDGDVVVYADAGCELNPDTRFLAALIAHAAARGMAIADVRTPVTRADSLEYVFENGALIVGDGHDHYTYAKMDLLLRFPELQPVFGRQMCGAGILGFRKSREVVEFIDAWYEMAGSEDYHFIDDSPSHAANAASFREHRHDQSIFSLLVYTRWPQIEFTLLPYLAFIPVRNRSGKNGEFLNELVKRSLPYEITPALVRIARTSSVSAYSHGAQDPYLFLFVPARNFLFAPSAPAFAFHTESEIGPFWECLFTRPLFLDRLIVFNRPGYETRALPLRVLAYDASGALQSLLRVEFPFGGAHDKSPLLIELGSRLGRFSGLRLQVDADQATCLHLARLMICVPKWEL